MDIISSYQNKLLMLNGDLIRVVNGPVPTPPEPPEPPTPVHPDLLWLSYIDDVNDSGVINKVVDNTGNNINQKLYYTSWVSGYRNCIHTVESVDGILPASYIGKKYFASSLNGAGVDQVNTFPLRPSDFTVGFWAKNVGVHATGYQTDAPCNFGSRMSNNTNVILSDGDNTHGFGLLKAGQYQLPVTYNGTTKETYHTNAGDTTYYVCPCGVGNVWHYCHAVFTRKIGSYRPVGGDPLDYGCIDYYINGVKYLRQYMWTKDFEADHWISSADNWYRSRMLSFNCNTDGAAIMEVAVYEGRTTFIPSQPLH